MRTLQERLRERRFYDGPIDGAYGPSVRTAIETFEAASRLPVTGLATEELLKRLGGLPKP
jgi:peptidoglycan hydrolase-like protein with peptidoglycan-binding domain